VLQPNRFEISQAESQDSPIRKVYVDPEFESILSKDRDFTHYFQDRASIEGRLLGRPIRFNRARYPYSSCFFLTNAQIKKWS